MFEEIDGFNDAAESRPASSPWFAATPSEWSELFGTGFNVEFEPLVAAVTPVLEAFRKADAPVRLEFGAKLRRAALGALGTFASGTGLFAVRCNQTELIQKGLEAVVVLGQTVDIRDLIFKLAVLYHSARKLGIDAERLFSDVARLSSDDILAFEMRHFPMREPSARDLGAFRFREVLTNGMYDIVQDPIGDAHKFNWLRRRHG